MNKKGINPLASLSFQADKSISTVKFEIEE